MVSGASSAVPRRWEGGGQASPGGLRRRCPRLGLPAGPSGQHSTCSPAPRLVTSRGCGVFSSGSPVLLPMLSLVPIARVAAPSRLTSPCPRPQDEADAHHRQLLVLQPGHGGAVREPQLLGLSALRAVQRLPGGTAGWGRRGRGPRQLVQCPCPEKQRIRVQTEMFPALRPIHRFALHQGSAGFLQRPDRVFGFAGCPCSGPALPGGADLKTQTQAAGPRQDSEGGGRPHSRRLACRAPREAALKESLPPLLVKKGGVWDPPPLPPGVLLCGASVAALLSLSPRC